MNLYGIGAYVVGGILLLWYVMVFGYMYVNIGNSDDFASYSNQLGVILGFAMLGTIVMACGMMALIGAVFEFNIDATIILTIVISSLAVGASVASLAIASIIH
jgi:hypothetical protein